MTSKLHLPNSKLIPILKDYTSLLGTWHVIASTLPLWINKKNVTITYSSTITILTPNEPTTTFNDLVTYQSRSDPVGTTPSTVKGIDRLVVDGNGSQWKWRGSGWLYPITSHWQLLGHSLQPPTTTSSSSSSSSSSSTPTTITETSTPNEPEWIVTYFASTLFTPAGLDIYSRTPHGLSDEFVTTLTEELVQLGGEVEKLCRKGGMFRVPHDA